MSGQHRPPLPLFPDVLTRVCTEFFPTESRLEPRGWLVALMQERAFLRSEDRPP